LTVLIFTISLCSAKLVNLSFVFRWKMGVQIKLWSQSLVSAKDQAKKCKQWWFELYDKTGTHFAAWNILQKQVDVKEKWIHETNINFTAL